jgi:curved DNA-binding protein
MKFKDYYQALGLERTASVDDVKKAYRKLAHRYHPDVSKDPQGEEKFKEVAEAYATLKDPEKRAAYDQLGSRGSGEQFTPPPDWQQRYKTDAAGFDDVDLADIFAAFGRSGSRGRSRQDFPVPGQDYKIAAPVSLEQVFRGGEIEIHAELAEYDKNGLAHRVAHVFKVTLPNGATDGQRLRLAGKGGSGLNGGRAGDLYVVLSLLPHPLYRVSGRDLYLDLPLAPWEAVLGCKVEIPTLAGQVELNIKPGTLAGQKLRLAKRGLAASDGSNGALYALVRIEVPAQIGPREHVLYEQLAANSTFSPRAHFAKGAAS